MSAEAAVAPAAPTAFESDGPRLQWEIEQFLYAEARILDDRLYFDWIGLMTDDVLYQMPLRIDRTRRDERRFKSGDEIMIFDDNKKRLETRVKRLMSGTAWSDDPRARARHMVSNVQIEGGDRPDELKVTSAFLVYLSRMDEPPTLFSGRRDDVLRRTTAGGWQIAKRLVTGDQSVIPSNNLVLFF